MDKLIKARITILFVAAIAYSSKSQCPFSDSSWNRMRGLQKSRVFESVEIETLSSSCFVSFLHRIASEVEKKHVCEQIEESINSYHKANDKLNVAQLQSILDAIDRGLCPRLSRYLFSIWQKEHGPPRQVFAGLRQKGEYLKIDSLYNFFYSAGAIDVYALIRWSRVKGIIQDYVGASRILCEVAELQPRLLSSMRVQLISLLRDASDVERARALDKFYKCRLKSGRGDTLQLFTWLSRAYSEFGMYERVTEIIDHSSLPSRQKGVLLLDIAGRCFRRGKFDKTIPPASRAFGYLDNERMVNECSVMLYRSYSETGRADSTVVWLKRAKLSNERNRVVAAALYQKAGLLKQADSLISFLAPSVSRDTLEFRQLIFGNSFKRAQELVVKRVGMKHWRGRKADACLWRTRTSLFAADVLEVARCLESAHFDPSWHGAHEMLSHKYALQFFKMHPGAYEQWATLQRLLYMERVQRAADKVDFRGFEMPVQQLFAVTLAEKLNEKQKYKKTLEVLDGLRGEKSSARVNYYRAEAMVMQGMMDKAKDIFEKLVLEYPHSIFSSKARMYLLDLSQKLSM